MNYPEFFQKVTGGNRRPFPYQDRLATEPWPELLDVPTGLGKTAAVVVAWLYKRLQREDTGTRLVYCLPMRVLVEQTQRSASDWCERARSLFEEKGLPTPGVHLLMGGEVDDEWESRPEHPAILIGTQDMLLSRALNRGYALSRYKWPVHYSLLNNDCLWVFDETQLVGVGIETSAQLQGLRQKLGVFGSTRTLWMSATLGDRQLDTVDHRKPESGFQVRGLSALDLDNSTARSRVSAKKPIERIAGLLLDKDSAEGDYIKRLAERILAEHNERGGLTLVVVNRVSRAQELYDLIRTTDGRTDDNTALVHSRFRPADRGRNERILTGEGDRIVIATQAVEAGVDVSSLTLITELASWPSLVQRLGRCNRYGGENARALWADIDSSDEKSGLALPYPTADLDEARTLLEALGADAGPEALRKISYAPPDVVRPVIRRKDLLDLFDTTPDLCGSDIDISRYVRDGEDTDVQVYWRAFEDLPPPDLDQPKRQELCRVSVSAFRVFSAKLEKSRKKLADGTKKDDKQRARRLRAWVWDPLERQWEARARVFPGQVVLLHEDAGGYSTTLGWTGEPNDTVPTVGDPSSGDGPRETATDDSLDSDHRTDIGRWVRLADHLGHVRDEARALAQMLTLWDWEEVLGESGLWHDVGKSHEEFQKKLLGPLEEDERPQGLGPWAKSNHRRPFKGARRHFRHELASALAWLQLYQGEDKRFRDLVAYLVAAHHGKVRMSLRSIPGEDQPDEGNRLFARGVWDGEQLPPFQLPDGRSFEDTILDLSPMQLGEGSWLERMLALRDAADLGPFRLALLETIVRIADWRASEKEQRGEYDE